MNCHRRGSPFDSSTGSAMTSRRIRTAPSPTTGSIGRALPATVRALPGPNGAGKSTLVEQIVGLLDPTSGTITIDAEDFVADDRVAR